MKKQEMARRMDSIEKRQASVDRDLKALKADLGVGKSKEKDVVFETKKKEKKKTTPKN